MIVDFGKTEADSVIQADICIIGGGAAGITLAKSFIGSKLNICLLESGGYDYDDDIQSLYDVENKGVIDTIGFDSLRLRFFGGTTNHWGGICGPLNDIDFQERSWVPFSGWPIDYKDLESYYKLAHPILDLGPYHYTSEELTNEKHILPEVLAEKLITRYYRLSTPPTRFSQSYQDELKKTDNIHVYLNANVTKLDANENVSNVKTANIETLDGHKGEVKAKVFVIACGAIETARLLLLSNNQNKVGIGNENDVVGRYYSTHPHTMTASLFGGNSEKLALLYAEYRSGQQRIKPKLCPSPVAQKREKILNCSVTIDSESVTNTGFDILQQIKRDIGNGEWPDNFGNKLSKLVEDFDSTFDRVYNKMMNNPDKAPMKVVIQTRSEQSPNPDSRIYLSPEKDKQDLNKIVLDWQLTDLDRRTVKKTNLLVGEELGRLGLGRIKLDDWLLSTENNWPSDYMTSYGHHMGTTRMAENPKYGVVDKNCRVHSVNNLYIAGGSVFPTAGYINPTLTIVAMSLRLADHLKKTV